MSLVSPSLVATLNYLVGPLGLSAQAVDAFFLEGDDGILVSGLSHGPLVIRMPHWTVEEWRMGFGGWLITSGKSVRFVRQKLSHPALGKLVEDLNYLAAQRGPDGQRYDVRTADVEARIQHRLKPEGFYFQDFGVQLAECLAEALTGLITGRTRESQRRAASKVKAAVSKFLNSFMIVRSKMAPEALEKLKFAQFKVTLGYPRTGLPVGTEGFFRDWFARFLYDKTQSGEGVLNCWNEGPFTTSLPCTSKGDPGDWLTMIPPQVYRDTPAGRILTRIETPVMMAAQAAVGYNKKRFFREGNGWSNAVPFAAPRPLDHCLKNGFEYAAGTDLANRRTEALVVFASVEGLNRYRDPRTGEMLNLDDILVTPEGAQACRAHLRHREEMSAEEWQERALEFVEPDGTMKPGFELDPNLVRATSVKGQDIFSLNPTVYFPPEPDRDKVFKLLVEGHKAMVKTCTTHLCGRDAQGHLYPIDVVVSGDSLKDKKLPYLPLSAVAGRAGLRYWENFEQPIHPNRKEFVPDPLSRVSLKKQYLRWAEEEDDLVRAVARKLNSSGEDPQGFLDIYAWEPQPEDTQAPYNVDPTLDAWWNQWTLVGRAVAGYCRVTRLWENERSSSKSKADKAVPRSPFLNFLGDDEAKPTQRDLDDLSIIIASYKSLPRTQSSEGESIVPLTEEEQDAAYLV